MSTKRYETAPVFTACCLILLTTLQGNLNASDMSNANSVISAEASGKPINRRQILANASDDISQWQAGRILIDGKWLVIEDLQEHKLSPQIEAYRKQRNSQELDIEGHRRMAKWCKEHQLPEMATVHWKAVIATAVDDEQARKALGHKRIGNDWFTAEELNQAADDQKQEKADLKQWMPQVRKIVAKLQSADTKTKLAAMKDLDKIDAVAAVPALKYGVFQLEPTIALSLVTKIKSIHSKPSCLALCEIAVSDPNSEVGRLAIEGLKQYDEHFYVPELLQMLELPIKLRQEFVYLSNGTVILRKAYLRETMTEKELNEVDKLITLKDPNTQTIMFDAHSSMAPSQVVKREIVFLLTGGTRGSFETQNAQAKKSMDTLGKLDAKSSEVKIDALNDLRLAREHNVRLVLSSITGLSANERAEAYWDWWPNYNENYTSYEKPTTVTKVLDDSNYSLTRMTVNLSVVSCLIAGTPIQTSDGLRPIEELQIGDMVASVNANSGETSLRPIVYLSNRVADATYIFTTDGGETIRATGGHYWWVVGKGWQRTRELQVGQYMRTGSASVEIKKIEKIESPIKVFNLIIDQTHTYLVGNNRLLSWDLSALQPTLQTAPGQTAQIYAVKK